MASERKCTPNPDLGAGSERYKEKLEENCDAIIENQKCFHEAAQNLNRNIDEVSLVADYVLSNGQTVDEWYGGALSAIAERKIKNIGSDPYAEDDTAMRVETTKAIIGWQVGYDSSKANAGVKSRFKASATGAAEADETADRRRMAQALGDAQEEGSKKLIAGRQDGSLTPDDIDYLRLAQGNINKIAAASSQGSGFNSCAENFDKIEQEMQTALGNAGGVSANMMGVDPAERARAAAAALRERDPETREGFGVDEEIEYNEQCILLSQIVPLARYHRSITSNSDSPHVARLPYFGSTPNENAPLYVDGEAYGFINRLTQDNRYRELFNMKNADLASLQPLIRFYKVIETETEQGKKSIAEHEIAFDSFASNEYGDISDIFNNKERRGFGVGLKSFNVSFEGQDMFAATRSIKAKLKIQANSFDELLVKRESKSVAAKSKDGASYKTGQYRYIDLALKTGGSEIEKYSSSMNELNFRLKAVFGWNPNAKNIGVSREALNQSFVSINLTPVKHYFDFDEQGRVTFTIEYFAYIEELLSKPSYNIFTDSTVFSKILARRLAYSSLELTAACEGSSDNTTEQKAEREKADAEKIEKEKTCMMNHLITQMFREDKIHILKFTRDELKRVVKETAFFKFDQDNVTAPSESAAETLKEDLDKQWKSFQKETETQNSALENVLVSPVNENEVQIPFLYAGDIVDVIMKHMQSFLEQTREFIANTQRYEDIQVDPALKNIEVKNLDVMIEQYKKFRLILGPLELENHGAGGGGTGTLQHVNVNFADVPITVAQFTEFLTSKLLQKDQAIYPLNQFLKDFFNLLIKNYLNKTTCKGVDVKQKTRLFESCITAYGNPIEGKKNAYVDGITYAIVNQIDKYDSGPRLFVQNANYGAGAVPFLNVSGKSDFNMPNPGLDAEFNHYIFYAGRVQPTNLMNGDRDADENRGIFHYLLGKDSGIVKNIQLNKTETPGLAEVRFESEGFKELQQLRVIYDVEIDSYVNVKAFPGAYIFVDPKGFAPNMAAFDQQGFDLTDMGIGGYYMIIRSEHEFAPGTANSRLTAVWVHSKDSQGKNQIVEQGGGKNKMVKSKCSAKRKKLGLRELASVTNAVSQENLAAAPVQDTVSKPPQGS
tara:strand:+ start:19435 stop:22794 length:3360 start_codon:yes stop_codon:yes gene_type:complete